jgi:ribosomal protein S18 acetylase RimI-like enzyme
MISIARLTKEEIPMTSQLISKLNVEGRHHIGYLGIVHGEISQSFEENFQDIGLENCFVAAYENDQIIGLLGFDGDHESEMAELWRPFIDHEEWDYIAEQLWDNVKIMIPDYTRKLGMFCGSQNTNCIGFALAKGFVKHSSENILTIEKPRFIGEKNKYLLQLTPQYHSKFIELHDKLFPGTYYSGVDIIKLMNNSKKVFIKVQDNQLQGYIYVEFNEEFEEGTIEFIGVDINHRGKGYGQILLEGGLSWIFENHNINDLKLCVNTENKAAINLYKKVGFKESNQLVFLKKTLT